MSTQSTEKGLDPEFRAQRLHGRVRKADSIALKKLQQTAWSMLDVDKQEKLKVVIHGILQVSLSARVNSLQPGETYDYNPMVNEAIRKAFEENIKIFTWKDKDGNDVSESSIDELMNMNGV
ncbi:hypothetical protein JX265_003898 [Neoarthrinium moseri]|uniref:Uncharacterized protein n=1 Tax=Neoarthrinium moseri TaxID=1658444 RepID=A0A9P9WRA2_9PEZI|nr:uncharacterized protein JN550_009462 [Neoarthrinium moseri]KAI1853768.1 hypothetical protein JX266_001752 [Neoarthrinium moseri]KAI1863762.1 hypothetical protein JN550_009462 [Neoarthrinium moseri]KAI1876372.1 hypothetical protein JX265_003898 [Neoarthrinium moseri]